MRLAVLISMIVLVFAFAQGFVRSGNAQEVAPEQSALLTACAQAGALAESSGQTMTRCRLVGIGTTNPNYQIITVQVKINGQGLFQVKVYLTRSVWNIQTFTITPEVR